MRPVVPLRAPEEVRRRSTVREAGPAALRLMSGRHSGCRPMSLRTRASVKRAPDGGAWRVVLRRGDAARKKSVKAA